jgi:hypothetical protein
VSFEISPFSWGLVVTLLKPKSAKIGCIMHLVECRYEECILYFADTVCLLVFPMVF